MHRLPIVVDHVAADMCAECGGECCQTYPGYAHPNDFGAPDDATMVLAVVDAIRSGRWAIDIANADGVLAVRPAIAGHEGIVVDDLYERGTCTFWSREGCGIFAARPTGCRMLRPVWDSENGADCDTVEEEEHDFIAAWRAQQPAMQVVLSMLSPKGGSRG